jgi:hypothetical protein
MVQQMTMERPSSEVVGIERDDNAPTGSHESPRTTKLYDRTGDEITLDEVERITI